MSRGDTDVRYCSQLAHGWDPDSQVESTYAMETSMPVEVVCILRSAMNRGTRCSGEKAVEDSARICALLRLFVPVQSNVPLEVRSIFQKMLWSFSGSAHRRRSSHELKRVIHLSTGTLVGEKNTMRSASLLICQCANNLHLLCLMIQGVLAPGLQVALSVSCPMSASVFTVSGATTGF